MNTKTVAALREEKAKAMKNWNRLMLGMSNHYTKTLNEGFNEIAQGVLSVNLPYAICQTEEEFAMRCLYVDIVFYPPNIDAFCTLSDFIQPGGGISVNKFNALAAESHGIDVDQLVAMYAVSSHVNKVFKLGDTICSHCERVHLRIVWPS